MKDSFSITGGAMIKGYMADGGQPDGCRALFGDDTTDYEKALQRHYKEGPPQDWQQHYVSAYATAHPWEDFAETWAHYLHIVDTLEMAFAFGIRIRPGIDERSGPAVVPDFNPHDAGSMNRLIEAWLPLTFAVNSIIRCMGESDFYPFVLSPRTVTKLGFIHALIHQDRRT